MSTVPLSWPPRGTRRKNLVSFPARDEKVIAVSASDHRKPNTKAPFSNWGPEVAVTAPGVDIASTLPVEFCGGDWDCLGTQPYALASGTSFSAPLVSGTVALILSLHPNLTPDQVKAQLTSTAVLLPDGSFPGLGGKGPHPDGPRPAAEDISPRPGRRDEELRRGLPTPAAPSRVARRAS